MKKPYEKYKPSGVEWIGEIPGHWKSKKLKYIAKINPPKPSFQFDNSSDREVVFLPMERVYESGKINQELRKGIREVSSGFTCFAKSDVIVAKITPCFENGKGALLDDLETDLGYGSTEFHVLRAIESVSPKFLFYVTKTYPFMKTGEAFMTGSAGQKRVPSSFIESFLLGFPPSDEQTAIANFLDKKTLQIDTLIANKQKLIELLKEERTAIINQAVTKGINPKAKLKPSGIDWLGDIPEHWEVKKLKYVAKLKSGESITADSIRDEGEYPVFGGNGLRGYTSSYSHEGDFVLIGRQGALCGNINYATGKFWASEHAVVATPNVHYKIIWLGELLRAMNLNQYSQSAAQPGLAVERIQNLAIAVPPYEEQEIISTHIEIETYKIDVTISKIEKEIELMKEYRTALISEVVTGKIKVAQEIMLIKQSSKSWFRQLRGDMT